MAEQYKIIHPVKYYRDFLNCNIRPDGREFDKFRPIAINADTIKTADGSSVVKIGNTTVVCGIKAELIKPDANQPDVGFLIPTIELIPICSLKYRQVNTSSGISSVISGVGSGGNSLANGDSEFYSCALNDIIVNSKLIDLKDLCIKKDKLVWVLYCDISVLDHDGCIIDASLMACLAALKNLKLPKVDYDVEIDKISVDINIKNPIKINYLPVSTTLMVFDDNIIITDPTREEEELSSGTITIAVCNSEVMFVLKSGGTAFDQEKMDKCLQQAVIREKDILQLLNITCNKNIS